MGLCKHRCSVVAGVLLLSVLSACAMNRDTTSEGAPLARQITASGQCGFTAPGLVYMDSRERLDALSEARGVSLVAVENHDFEREHLLLVAAGRKPSGGYGVALEESRIREGVLEITVEVRSPAPDQAVTMALTSPCALLAVTAEGWSRATVSGPGFEELSFQR